MKMFRYGDDGPLNIKHLPWFTVYDFAIQSIHLGRWSVHLAGEMLIALIAKQ